MICREQKQTLQDVYLGIFKHLLEKRNTICCSTTTKIIVNKTMLFGNLLLWQEGTQMFLIRRAVKPGAVFWARTNLRQIHLSIWTNHFALWTNIFCDLHKYI